MNNYSVYIHKNKLNGKVYIGQTSQKPEKRWDNGKGYETSPKFFNAILKYGWNNFEHTILYTNLSLEEANQIEQDLIQKYKSNQDEFGYNITSGGKNFKHSEETKQKIGQSNHIALQGNRWSEEQRQLISKMFSGEGNPFYGKKHSEESKQKISESRKGKCSGEEHFLYGRHHNEETKQKISESRKNKGGKRVKCINTGETFETMMDAARWCGLTTACSIGQVCNKKRKTAGKHPITLEKLIWEFVD